ncbi:hypothetical protein HYH03_012871 [Edaphochlamys debaryana]|uniref:Uncharacterized protein n=1 Tax=Edaphochlamys debaryana TaxID=47281 RepID=A0A835XP79_9CHLO|nr:hypothetical protein HYH03_012871 [Edaphochlamys debaryana]|eukprot:KAG2488552.1 hypothetical protein HYH03_012871 [Edaphochlamys debaryana]
MAKSTSVLLAMLVCAGLALASAEPGRKLLQKKGCTWDQYRYYSSSRFAEGTDVQEIFDINLAMAKECSKYFVRAIMGMDLGYGPSLYNSSTNMHMIKVFDFKSQADFLAYRKCDGALPNNPIFAAVTTVQKGKSIIPIASCHKYHANPVEHYFAYNVTTKDHSSAALDKINGLLGELVSHVDCTWQRGLYRKDMGWAEAAGENPAGYMPIAGGVEYKNENYMRAYWGYLIGPPRASELLEIAPLIDNSLRMQYTPVNVM